MSRRPIRYLVLASLLLGITACTPCCNEDCPAIRFVSGDLHDGSRFNVLFVGDGFTNVAQLRSYRAAVEQLVVGLWASPDELLGDFEKRFNFYRMDVIDDGGVADHCSSAIEIPVFPGLNSDNPPVEPVCSLAPIGTHPSFGAMNPAPVVAGSGVLRQDLRLRLCHAGPGICKSLGMVQSARDKLFRISGRIGPSFDAVVVIGNLRSFSGGASFRVGGEKSIAYVGVPIDDGGPVWKVTLGAVRLFAHELAHAVGLYDEYMSSGTYFELLDPLDTTGIELLFNFGGLDVAYPNIEPERNVWHPAHVPGRNRWEPDTVHVPTTPVPWQDALNCQPESAVECGSAESPPCPVPGLTCGWAPKVSGFTCRQIEQCDAQAGFWEGAYYSETDYFRSNHDCLMLRTDSRTCKACRLALERHLCCYGPGRCDSACRAHAVCHCE